MYYYFLEAKLYPEADRYFATACEAWICATSELLHFFQEYVRSRIAPNSHFQYWPGS